MWGLPLFAAQIRGDCLSEGFGTSELLKASNCRRFHNSIDMCVFGGFNASILFYGVSDGLYNLGPLY